MHQLNRRELYEVTGGASKGAFAVIIGGVASFLIGIIGGQIKLK